MGVLFSVRRLACQVLPDRVLAESVDFREDPLHGGVVAHFARLHSRKQIHQATGPTIRRYVQEAEQGSTQVRDPLTHVH